MSQDRDSIERELKDTFSFQEETVKKLKEEVACQKVGVYCVHSAVVYLYTYVVQMYISVAPEAYEKWGGHEWGLLCRVFVVLDCMWSVNISIPSLV